ncbi:MAG: hypothetical protein AB7L65_05885 [Hyphomonadaceae bacterium]
MLKKAAQIAAGVAAFTAFGVAQASAEICILNIICLGGGGGSGGGTPHAPEIDLTSGLAAAAVLACVGLLLRERFLRARKQRA